MKQGIDHTFQGMFGEAGDGRRVGKWEKWLSVPISFEKLCAEFEIHLSTSDKLLLYKDSDVEENDSVNQICFLLEAR